MLDDETRFPDRAFGPEWALLELLCLGIDDPRREIEFAKIIESPELNWGELLEQAIRHKLLPMLASKLRHVGYGYKRFGQIMPHLIICNEVHKHKLNLYYRELIRIVDEFESRGIRFACTKGITLEPSIYGGNCERAMSDMDFMVSLQDGETIFDCMTKLGFRVGSYDWRTRGVKEPDRRERVMTRLYPDHLPDFVRLTEDPVIRYINVDFATSLTWTRSPFHVPVESALAEVVPLVLPGHPGVSVPRLSTTFQFLFTVLHLFREAWLVEWDEWAGNDVNLMKFGDVVRLLRTYEETLVTEALVQNMEQYGITDAILWVLEHTDRALGTSFVPALGLAGRASESWLASACAVGGKRLQWKGTMRERLHCKHRRVLFFDMA